MDDGDLLDIPVDGLDVAAQFVLVRVAGKGVDRGDAGADLVGLAKDVHRVRPDMICAPRVCSAQ